MSEQKLFAKCAWRLIPFMMLLYLVNYIDRVNVGFAALTMNRDLGFSPSIFGFGAGVFFLGYALSQVPVNVTIERVGAKRSVFWILAIWGVLSASTAAIQSPASFYALRFVLGIAEAGFFPGMLLYLTFWFPQAYRARITANFMAAIPLAAIVGGPLSSLILGLDGAAGLHGWQWLFLLEGLPAFLLAFVALKFLPDGPQSAPWLTSNEKNTIAAQLTAEDSAKQHDLWAALIDLRVFALALVNFGVLLGAYGVQLWLPQIVQGMGFSNSETGIVVALPYAIATGAMILWGRSSDRRGERIWHVALPALLAAAGLAVVSMTESDLVSFVALTVAVIGILCANALVFSLPGSFLHGPAAASGIALIVSISSLGGFLGPTIVGVLKQRSGGYASGMAVLALGLVLSAAIVLVLGRAMAPRPMFGTNARVS